MAVILVLLMASSIGKGYAIHSNTAMQDVPIIMAKQLLPIVCHKTDLFMPCNNITKKGAICKLVVQLHGTITRSRR
jgi:hypothetical protein